MRIFPAGLGEQEVYKQLLAKSVPDFQEESPQQRGATTYTGHIALVMEGADILLDEIGADILQQLGLSSLGFETFAGTVRLAAYLHDWGKANQHFQEMVRLSSSHQCFREHQPKLKRLWSGHGERQMIRHEFLSAILALRVPSFRKWLSQQSSADLVTAVWAAMGHHLQAGLGLDKKPAGELTQIPDGTGQKLNIYTHHHDFGVVLDLGTKRLNLPGRPELPQEIWTKDELEEALRSLRDEFIDYEYHLDQEQQRFIAAVKATVIAADLAGSLLPKVGEDLNAWMRDALHLSLSAQDIQALLDKRLDGKELRPFQVQMAQAMHRVTLVKAGCGTGKTGGAYAWAKQQAKDRRLFFCYPTTGTATQGFLDYADGAEMEAALIHSRADLDRDLLFNSEGNPEEDDTNDHLARLKAFQAWRKPLVICTVDTVLGLIQNNRNPLYAWPALAQAAFVFDEVHAYDDRLFGALLQFLKAFRGAPILLMSASFRASQLKALHQVLGELGEADSSPIEGPSHLEVLKRYSLQQIESSAGAWPSISTALQHGEKVLWVTNSVKDCIHLYRQAQTQLSSRGVPILIYHSRFRYRDRVQKHKALIAAFRESGPALAITTQVCEMSLDISCDLLVTAMAPAAALIQRLGRLNRYMGDPKENAKPAMIYPWPAPLPYKPEEMATGNQLIAGLADPASISQRDLAEGAAGLDWHPPKDVKSQWLEGNWATYRDFLREAGYTITVVLKEDLQDIWQEARFKKKSFNEAALGWAVPIPVSAYKPSWKRQGYYPIAQGVSYSEEVGAEP
ncbi:MAG: CRISPR-associated helicase Cas3' [Gloeomargaritaceae cyanobacterium C42_A2020_066]|nr:CRISPR-associated helicase Cas3' [Gloeomargaritaceae cyanobacterium C42_A2020_066]